MSYAYAIGKGSMYMKFLLRIKIAFEESAYRYNSYILSFWLFYILFFVLTSLLAFYILWPTYVIYKKFTDHKLFRHDFCHHNFFDVNYIILKIEILLYENKLGKENLKTCYANFPDWLVFY